MIDRTAPSIAPTGTDGPLRLAVIVGSTRRGPAGEVIARWFVRQVEGRDDLTVDLIDLAETDLPTVRPDFDREESRTPSPASVCASRQPTPSS